MKLQTLQMLQILIECRNMVGGASVHISKHSLFRLKITVGCLTSAYPSIHVESLKITVGCLTRALCGVVWYVLFCVVWCGLACGKPPPCVDSKCLRVCVQDASVCTGKTPSCPTHAGVFLVQTETF